MNKYLHYFLHPNEWSLFDLTETCRYQLKDNSSGFNRIVERTEFGMWLDERISIISLLVITLVVILLIPIKVFSTIVFEPLWIICDLFRKKWKYF